MITYPIRINHYLAEKQVTTRRNADVLIDEGKIFINGKRAKIGQMVQEKDKVSWDKAVKQNYSYIAYYKPLGLVTVAPQPGERVIDLSKFPKGVSPVGRLDKDSEGLIILSDDGRITDALLNPKKKHEKEYRVVVNRKITNSLLRGLKEGMRIGAGDFTRPAKTRKVDEETFDIILTEGKNRQIRRMCKALGFEVKSLLRFRIMDIKLGNMKPGDQKKLEGKQLSGFLESLGIPTA